MNFVDNPIFGADGEICKGNSTIEEQQSGGEEQKDGQGFAERFAKAWPLSALKTINSILLLLLGIIACNGTKYEFSIGWSHFGDVLPYHIRPENSGAWTRTMDLYSCFVVMFVLSALSLILFFVLRKNANANGKLLFGIAIADFIVALISVPILINSFAIYGLMATAEWKWFYPKLRNSSMTLAELTDWSVQHGRWNTNPYYQYTTPSTWPNGHPYYQRMGGPTQRPSSTTPTPPPTTTMPIPEDWQVKMMLARKKAILARLGLDSSAAVLLGLLILLNLFLIFRLRKLLKSANVCQNDWRTIFKDNDDEKKKKYSKSGLVGFFKFAHWFIPTLAILLFQYYTLSLFQWIWISLVSFFFFANWFKFRNNSANKFPPKIIPFDFMISLSAIAFYIIFIASSGYGRALIVFFCQSAIVMHIFHLIFILFLFFKEGGENGEGNNSSLLDLKLPLISINLAINVIHQNGGNEGKKEAAMTMMNI